MKFVTSIRIDKGGNYKGDSKCRYCNKQIRGIDNAIAIELIDSIKTYCCSDLCAELLQLQKEKDV